ncbi:MAG: hypothetical protein M1339_06880 [Bacteroidetes bacterium]|nr:hypothetical protein [Bacteroidota bacterium]
MKSLPLVILVFVLAGCENPFAPKLATQQAAPASFLSNQSTIDGVFQNFVYAYTFRDTTVYSKLIAPNFTFTYRDYDRGVDVAWGRDDEMRSTSMMFKFVNRLILNWNNIVSLTEDSLNATVTRGFTLTVAFNPADIEEVDGKAYFELQRASSSSPWQISFWKDESNF